MKESVFMNYIEFIRSELLILIPVLYFVGVGLKKSKLPNRWIPAALGVVAVFLATSWVIADSNLSCCSEFAAAIFTGVTQGVLVAGASVYANQIYRQATKDGEGGDIDGF